MVKKSGLYVTKKVCGSKQFKQYEGTKNYSKYVDNIN